MRRQEDCFVNEAGAGAAYMGIYDRFPADVRKRLQESQFNICAACVDVRARDFGLGLDQAINLMESRLRARSY